MHLQRKHKAGGEKLYYVCAHQSTGGDKQYEKKHPEWGRKVLVKWCGCMCKLIVKIYPHMSHIAGRYYSENSHPIGSQNAQFTLLPKGTHIQIAEMLRMGISHDQVVSEFSVIVSINHSLTIYRFQRYMVISIMIQII